MPAYWEFCPGKRKASCVMTLGRLFHFHGWGCAGILKLGFWPACCAELRLGFFKLVQGITFGASAESFRIDVRVAGESSACCGVNLAVARLGFWVLGFA